MLSLPAKPVTRHMVHAPVVQLPWRQATAARSKSHCASLPPGGQQIGSRAASVKLTRLHEWEWACADRLLVECSRLRFRHVGCSGDSRIRPCDHPIWTMHGHGPPTSSLHSFAPPLRSPVEAAGNAADEADASRKAAELLQWEPALVKSTRCMLSRWAVAAPPSLAPKPPARPATCCLRASRFACACGRVQQTRLMAESQMQQALQHSIYIDALL